MKMLKKFRKMFKFIDQDQAKISKSNSEKRHTGFIPCQNYFVRDQQETIRITRAEIIQLLILENSYTSYLEIGVQNPSGNFDKIFINKKIGVDPNENANATFCMTSDDFFAQNESTFDIIFIDGLHESRQVKRDILNSLNILNNNGTIVIHDCNPYTEIMQRVPIQSSQWTGDVWKAFVELRSEISDYSFYVVDTDYGVGIIKQGENRKISINKQQLTYDNFEKNRQEWLNLISIAEFLEREVAGEKIWDSLAVATVSIDSEDLANILLPSVMDAGNFSIIVKQGLPNTCLAKEYNEIIRSTKYKYLLFCHQDFEFTRDFFIFANYIAKTRQYGAIGMYGFGFDSKFYAGGPPKPMGETPSYQKIIDGVCMEVSSLDSCCILINKEHEVFFDDETFDGLHLHVEDYCFQQRAQNKKILLSRVFTCKHHGTTTNKKQKGCAWGNYKHFADKIRAKWKGKGMKKALFG